MKAWKESFWTMNKLLSMAGICKKAGKLIIGFDLVKESVALKKAKIIFIASDISPKTKKEVDFLLVNTNIPLYQVNITLDEFAYGIGKRAGIFCVEDNGLAQKISALITQSL
ncbi:MAG: hypothetical protein K0R90_713 [Oscillospiraceae bacterium]|nr:hypothetical protein [Oscillospiraceae bacterium]